MIMLLASSIGDILLGDSAYSESWRMGDLNGEEGMLGDRKGETHGLIP
jgi:hypothetical protein